MYIDELERLIILYLLKTDQSISADRLASLCNTSRVTIRNHIKSINQTIRPYGLEIRAQRSAGYSLHVLNQQTADRELPKLLFSINRNQYSLIDRNYRSDYMIRNLLIADSYVSAQAICDALYISYSVFHRELSEVNAALRFFHLRIGNRRGYGYDIEGSEWDKRICLLFEHKRYIRLPEEKQAEEIRFGNLFFTHLPEYTVYRKSVLDVLQHFPEYEYSYISIPKVVNYLFLIRARRMEAKKLTFSKVQTDTVRQLPSYQIACEILKKNTHFLGFMPEDAEICSYAMIIESYRTLTSFSYVPKIYQISVMDECEALIQRVNRTYKFDLDKVEASTYDALQCNLYTIHMHQLFNAPNDLEYMFPQNQTHLVSHDLISEFQRCYKELFAISLTEDLTAMLFYTSRLIMQSQDYGKASLRIVIMSLYGIGYARTIAAGIRHDYADSVASVTAVESMPNTLHSLTYDILLTDIQAIYYSDDGRTHLWLNPETGKTPIETLDRYFQEQKNAELIKCTDDLIHISNCRSEAGINLKISKLIQKACPIDPAVLVKQISLQNQTLPPMHRNGITVLSAAQLNLPEHICILVNQTPISYEGQESQVFIFCAYDKTSQKERLSIGVIMDRLQQKSQSEWLTMLTHPLPLSVFLAAKSSH